MNHSTDKAAAANEYLLQSDDVVRIAVYQNPDLTLETRITEAGIVGFDFREHQ